jgi:hypothetical protein
VPIPALDKRLGSRTLAAYPVGEETALAAMPRIRSFRDPTRRGAAPAA